MLNLLRRLWKDEEGQGMVEYGLIIALISIAAIAIILQFDTPLKTIFQNALNALTSGASGT